MVATREDDYPKCPGTVIRKDCKNCETGMHKKCDRCGSSDKVRYRPNFGNLCLCRDCRLAYTGGEVGRPLW